MSKLKLCEVLGVEPMEEFVYQGYAGMSGVLRVNQTGHVQEKTHCGTWEALAMQFILECMIEKGITKLLYVSAKQLEYLRVLNDLFRPETLHKDCYGLYIQREKNRLVRIPECSCLNALFDESWTTINIPEILERYKEVPNV